MKKQDYIMVGLLFALLLAWPHIAGKLFPAAPGASAPQPAPSEAPLPAESAPAPASAIAPSAIIPAAAPAALDEVQPPTPAPLAATEYFTLTNTKAVITISAHGGALVSTQLKDYRQTVERCSDPVVLDFAAGPALAYSGLSGFAALNIFEATAASSATQLVLQARNAEGLRLTRSISLVSDYQLKIEDVFHNANSQNARLGAHEIQLGPMHLTGESRTMRLEHLGVDALPASGGEGVAYWAGKLGKLFTSEMKEHELPGIPQRISRLENKPVDWVAAKSKFFVQILVPDGGAGAYRLLAERKLVPGEKENPHYAPRSAEITGVAATLLFAEKTLAPGESMTRSLSYYVGPKKYSILKQLGLHQEEVMDFGWWKPVCKFLLSMLNLTYKYIPNYGIAIILLTILIRIIFWPLTHKSTESMKKMQALQPLMQEIRQKYKDNPKKMQEETMALYRQHKVNPLSGCLPMLVQIPVFVALFIVLRSAIELRFAGFLWISDLSEPERLLASILPIPLNILPIFMAVTMAWQQKLTPTGDPNQQKMMLFFMPAMMLFMFYNMPSALVLYWSANQCIMIVQMLLQKKRLATGKAQA